MQKQPIQGTDLKEVYGGGGDVCASLGVRVLGGGVCVCVVRGGGSVTTMCSLVAGDGEQART